MGKAKCMDEASLVGREQEAVCGSRVLQQLQLTPGWKNQVSYKYAKMLVEVGRGKHLDTSHCSWRHWCTVRSRGGSEEGSCVVSFWDWVITR